MAKTSQWGRRAESAVVIKMVKANSKEKELKVRIPNELMEEVRNFQHKHKIDKRKEAVVKLLHQGLSFDVDTSPPSKKD